MSGFRERINLCRGNKIVPGNLVGTVQQCALEDLTFNSVQMESLVLTATEDHLS